MDLALGDGRTLHVYDTGADDGDGRLAVFWHHGTPNIGAPPEPLFAAADRLGIRWVSYDRPGYGSSTPYQDRNVASAADYVSSIADTLGIDRFAVMGHSGGGPHALACGALLPERVLGVLSVSGMAPYGAEGLDYFAGMADSGAASLRAQHRGVRPKSASRLRRTRTPNQGSFRPISPRSKASGPGLLASSVRRWRRARTR